MALTILFWDDILVPFTGWLYIIIDVLRQYWLQYRVVSSSCRHQRCRNYRALAPWGRSYSLPGSWAVSAKVLDVEVIYIPRYIFGSVYLVNWDKVSFPREESRHLTNSGLSSLVLLFYSTSFNFYSVGTQCVPNVQKHIMSCRSNLSNCVIFHSSNAH